MLVFAFIRLFLSPKSGSSLLVGVKPSAKTLQKPSLSEAGRKGNGNNTPHRDPEPPAARSNK